MAPRGRLGTLMTGGTVLLAAVLTASGCGARGTRAPSGETATTASRLIPAHARLAAAPPALRERLVSSPIAFFRFVNQAWTREVCAAFSGDLPDLPRVRLHGDAHVEQYAVMAAARGLDDFDDSASGPAVVDMVRFLGSLELIATERGWAASLPSMVEAFFSGYRRALRRPAYLPPDPAVVRRLRAAPIKTQDAFLRWADSLMHPLAPDDQALLDTAWARIETDAVSADQVFTPAFLTRKKAGALRLGIGSALARKVLVRIEGPSPAADDDVLLEAKEVTPLRGEPCLTVPPAAEVFRVIEGLRQIGRLEHRLVVALPVLPGDRPGAVDWWVKTWERSYRELEIPDLASAEELGELAHDVGAQLGATNLAGSPGSPAHPNRLLQLHAFSAREARIRQVARELTAALLDAWQQLRTRSSCADCRGVAGRGGSSARKIAS